MPNLVLQKVSEPPIAVPWSALIQTALWLAVGLPCSPQLPCQTNMWPRKQSVPFSEFGRSVRGWGRSRAALPVWRLTDNTDSMSEQRRRLTSSPPRGSDAPSSTAGDDYVEVAARPQIKRGTAWSIFARYQRTGEVWGREAALSTIGWTGRARTCWWCVWMTIPRWRWNIWPSSCSSQSAGGADGDVATLGGWRRRILLDGISIAMQSVIGDQVAAQYRHSKHVLAWVRDEVRYLTCIWQDIWQVLCYQSCFALSLFWRVSTLMTPNVLQYWRQYIQSKYAPILFGQAHNLSSKSHEHCLIRFALCRIWNVCRNAALRRNCLFIRRIRCALSPKLYALYSITSSLILITCDTFEYGCTMPYCRKLTALFPNYVHCFQNWPEKGVDGCGEARECVNEIIWYFPHLIASWIRIDSALSRFKFRNRVHPRQE